MFWEILLTTIAGICGGIFTGLAPGIHINLVSLILISISPFLLNYLSLTSLACFIISMSVTQSFFDPIPSIFLGAPDDNTALGVLPGHRYLLKGLGLTALKLSIFGCFSALVISAAIFPLMIPLVKYGYPLIQNYIAYILIAIISFMILKDRKKVWALLIFLFSGCLGTIVLTWPNLKNPLFPLLSGLFGIATLIISLSESENLPKQKENQELKLDTKRTIKALVSGEFAGFLTAVLPGVGGSTAAVLALQFTKKLGDQGFMILMGCVNTVNFVLSLVTLLVLDKARNGSIVAIQQLLPEVTTTHIFLFICSSFIAGGISVFLSLKIGKLFSVLISKVNYKKLVLSIIIILVLLTIPLSGFYGLLILIVSTGLGLLPAILKTQRTHAMGCLLLPVILFFLV